MSEHSKDPQQGKKRAQKPDPKIEAPERDPLIPEGEYIAYCHRAEYGKSFGRKSLYVRFTICEGPYKGVDLFMACPSQLGRTRTRRKIYIQWCLAIDGAPGKGDRLNKDRVFVGKWYVVKVGTTTRKFKGSNKPLPPSLQYSVVETIIQWLKEEETPNQEAGDA